MSRKLPLEQVRQLDAADLIAHPIEKAKEPACFTLCGAAALNSYLLRNASDQMANTRAEYELVCPCCKSFIGFWIYAPSDVPLSSNQQRKNRNTLLMGKSHYRKFHEESALMGKQTLAQSSETTDDHDVVDMVSSRKRARVDSHSSSLTGTESELQDSISTDSESDEQQIASFSLAATLRQLSPQEQDEIAKAINEADEGDTGKQVWLGERFEQLQMTGGSIYWFKRAALAGQWRAQRQLALGYLIAQTLGFPGAVEKFHRWMLKAAEQGDSLAQFHVGDNFLYGQGVTASLKDSILWFRRAASSNSILEKNDPKFHADAVRAAENQLEKLKSKPQFQHLFPIC